MLATWMTKHGILFAASANGGSRNWLEALKLKRMGVSSGFPDLFIPIPTKDWHGFFIEMKREKGGVVSDQQKYWLNELTKKGYLAIVCRGFNEAKQKVMEYLEISN